LLRDSSSVAILLTVLGIVLEILARGRLLGDLLEQLFDVDDAHFIPCSVPAWLGHRSMATADRRRAGHALGSPFELKNPDNSGAPWPEPSILALLSKGHNRLIMGFVCSSRQQVS
jgi:hypothetical protein